MIINKFGISSAVFRKLGTAIFILSLQACVGSDISDLESFVVTAHQDRKPEIEPLPEIPPFKAFEYGEADEVDPFSSNNIVRSGDADGNDISQVNRPDVERRREPLEKYPLDSLRMVGTITKNEASHVIVKTSEGTALLATIGEYMGMNDGKIKSIIPDEQRVLLVETVLNPAGRWVTRDVEIKIDE